MSPKYDISRITQTPRCQFFGISCKATQNKFLVSGRPTDRVFCPDRDFFFFARARRHAGYGLAATKARMRMPMTRHVHAVQVTRQETAREKSSRVQSPGNPYVRVQTRDAVALRQFQRCDRVLVCLSEPCRNIVGFPFQVF